MVYGIQGLFQDFGQGREKWQHVIWCVCEGARVSLRGPNAPLKETLVLQAYLIILVNFLLSASAHFKNDVDIIATGIYVLKEMIVDEFSQTIFVHKGTNVCLKKHMPKFSLR